MRRQENRTVILKLLNVRKACAMLQNCRGNLKSFLLAFVRSSTPRTSVEWMLSPSRMGLIRRMPATAFPLPTLSLSRLKAIPDPYAAATIRENEKIKKYREYRARRTTWSSIPSCLMSMVACLPERLPFIQTL